jgi:TrmH family RNA methyltransferase
MQSTPRSRKTSSGAIPVERGRQVETISGSDNRWLRRFRVALAGGPDSTEGTIGIEGARLVDEALRSNIPVEAILVSETGRKHLARVHAGLNAATRVFATTDRLFARIADTETPQGVAALVRPPRASFDDLMGDAKAQPVQAPLIVVLVGLQDPGNVGTILRTAEALGATGAAACRSESIGTAHIFSPKVVRASAGAVFRLPVAEGVSTSILQAQLRVAGVRVLAATSATIPSDAASPWQTDFSGAVAIFIGNEGAGLPPEVERSADARVRIPLASVRGVEGPSVESLNAASAAAILLYEAARQRSAVTAKSKVMPGESGNAVGKS